MEGSNETISKICPSSIDYSVSKVEELYGPIDHGKAQGNKGIDAASDNTVCDQLLNHVFSITSLPSD